MSDTKPQKSLSLLALGALGVVFGDIGTSPLYTLNVVFQGGFGANVKLAADIYGILSLIFWALIWTVSIKYVLVVTRADDKGEGGIMVLTSLASNDKNLRNPKWRRYLLLLGIIGSAFFYGDSIITPAISVLSAVEGLELAAPDIKDYIVPIALALLVAIFYIQRFGTDKIGKFFGPIMVIWFVSLGVLGVQSIAENPDVLQAFNPIWCIRFFTDHTGISITILSAVVLALTGAEALYADMGHFGRKPIVLAWFFVVLPGLVLNYFGQGALLLKTPDAIKNPFFLLGPDWTLMPLVFLATLATIIASQAVISGAFSMTQQAIQLNLIPPLYIRHTSHDSVGQIYIPSVNMLLMFAVVGLVLFFQKSEALASAYGLAVTATMLITTILLASLILNKRTYPLWLAIPMLLAFFSVDLLFFLANAPKVVEGGVIPVTVGVVIVIMMTTWRDGSLLLSHQLSNFRLKMADFLQSVRDDQIIRVPGTAVYMTSNQEGVPECLLLNLGHYHVLHEQVIILTIQNDETPYVSLDRYAIDSYGNGFYRMTLRYGFMEDRDVPYHLAHHPFNFLTINPPDITYFMSRPNIVSSETLGMKRWRELIFRFMLRLTSGLYNFLHLPPNQFIEIGTQIKLPERKRKRKNA